MRGTRWQLYLKCPTCGAPCRKSCRTIAVTASGPKGTPMRRPHLDRPRSAWAPPPRAPYGRKGNPELQADRLATWKRLAGRGVLVEDIAHQLGMTREALDRMLCRARRAGHPDAVYHQRARPYMEHLRQQRAHSDAI